MKHTPDLLSVVMAFWMPGQRRFTALTRGEIQARSRRPFERSETSSLHNAGLVESTTLQGERVWWLTPPGQGVVTRALGKGVPPVKPRPAPIVWQRAERLEAAE